MATTFINRNAWTFSDFPILIGIELIVGVVNLDRSLYKDRKVIGIIYVIDKILTDIILNVRARPRTGPNSSGVVSADLLRRC